MNSSDYVYALQGLRFWLDDMTRRQHSRANLDPGEEEMMLQVELCYQEMWGAYASIYNPESNMVPPDLLERAAWTNFPAWPESLLALRPQDKCDTDKAKRLLQLPFERIEPCLPEMLTWLQDPNWPVAGAIVDPLAAMGDKLTPALLQALKMARQENDSWWVCNLILNLINQLPASSVETLRAELSHWILSEDQELGVMVIKLLLRHKLGDQQNLRRWARIKIDAYAEYIEELQDALKEEEEEEEEEEGNQP
ncbi:hypothetical protein HCH_00951 [Hahella chejuensis KCTC 2396]|uniref:DUF5071 domain-containing protein n=1 Tax=Hahella chejuensis (strain KCTC 2396) TaxID=349521 RepID=Q2SND5_HAHCH|nr:DUF5071 domain-containing protein [Hahella chejuensis]ABC27839.1 hypothetical protein HCH_00951 [Hahella chejuensis KCTC 2396]